MIITIINRDRKFPFSKVGLFYLLPAIAEKKFRLSLIDPALADLECNAQGQGLPYRFLALQDEKMIISYLRSLMAEKRERSFFNFWIMDETDVLLDNLASDLSFQTDRVNRRRNLLLINEYKKYKEINLPGDWHALHNGLLSERFNKGENSEPFHQIALLILVLVEWLARVDNRTDAFDTLFDKRDYQIHPDVMHNLQPNFISAIESRIAALVKQGNNQEIERAVSRIRFSANAAVDKLEEDLKEINSCAIGNLDAMAGDRAAGSGMSAAGSSPIREDFHFPRAQGLGMNNTVLPIARHTHEGEPIHIKRCAELRHIGWMKFRESHEKPLLEMEKDASQAYASARLSQTLKFDAKWDELAHKLLTLDLERVLEFAKHLEEKITALSSDFLRPKGPTLVDHQWKTILDNFNALKRYCGVERIPASVWPAALGVIYGLGAFYFGLMSYAILPLLPGLLPPMPSRPYFELAYWFILAFLPTLAAVGLHYYKKWKEGKLVLKLDASVIGLIAMKNKDLTSRWDRQKLELLMSYLQKVRVRLALLQRDLEEHAIQETKKMEFFKDLANYLHLKIRNDHTSAQNIPDIFAEYTTDGRHSMKFSLESGSSQKFTSTYLRLPDGQTQAATLRFEERKPSSTAGTI